LIVLKDGRILSDQTQVPVEAAASFAEGERVAS